MFLAVKKGTIEESKMLQLLTYAIKHEGTCICYGSGRIDVRTIDLASKYPVISKEINEWHKGWDNMRDAHFVDFYNLSCAERPFALEQAGFSKWIIDFWNSKDAYKYKNRFTSAIHVDLNDGTWEELIFNQTRPEDHFTLCDITVHAMKEVKGVTMTAKAVITPESKHVLYIEGPQNPTREMLVRYVSHPSIKLVFAKMEESGETEKIWDDTDLFESIISQTFFEDLNKKAKQEQDKKNQEIWDCLATGKSISRTQDVKNRPLTSSGIKSAIKQKRGYFFREQFVCRLCLRSHATGYEFHIDGHVVKVCTYCNDEIKQRKPWGKEILVNMGGKR